MTGTIAVFGYATGQYFTTVEEIEPFGQKVAAADPEYFEPTIETGSTTFSAGEPEWQCQISKEFYGGFSGMPEHCQQKALKAAGKELPWEFEIRESPHNIPSAPSGSGGASQTAGDRIVNLTATEKPDDDNDPQGSPVDPSQIPDDDGYDPYDTDVENTPEGMTIKRRPKELSLAGFGFVGADIPTVQDVVSGKVKRTEKQAECDRHIANTFGDNEAVAGANGFAPNENKVEGQNINKGYRGDYSLPDGKIIEGHLSSYAMHLWGNNEGTRQTRIFLPDGFDVERAKNQEPTATQAVVTFFYKELGNRKNVTLYAMHVKDFKIEKIAGRWSIGFIGGKGGISGESLHAHFEVYEGDIGFIEPGKKRNQSRIKNFASIFCD